MLNALLSDIASGKIAFVPENDLPKSAEEFQDIVNALRRLESDGLIGGLVLQTPSKSRGKYGLILRAVVSKGITDLGRLHLPASEQTIQSKPEY